MCDSPRTGCARRTKIYVARTSNNRVISSGDLYCCLLPRCEALRTCRSGFPIATLRAVVRYCKDSRNALVASLIDLSASEQPQVPLSLEDRHILSQKTSVPGTSGLVHFGRLQAILTTVPSHWRRQPKPPGVSQHYSTSGVNRVWRRGRKLLAVA